MKYIRGSLILATILLIGNTVYAEIVQFKAADPMGRNTVQFKTTAPLEDIVGTTNKIGGEIRVDPEDLSKGEVRARIEVQLAGLETGISLRDTHMREQYLHTDRYPSAVFTLERIRKPSIKALKPGKLVGLIAEGTFELHGTKHRIEVPVKATYIPESEATMGKLPGNLLRITSSFEIKLADYNIERPQMVLLKVGEAAHVTIDVFATDASPDKLTMWMEQMKKMMGGK